MLVVHACPLTEGESQLENAQPILFTKRRWQLAPYMEHGRTELGHHRADTEQNRPGAREHLVRLEEGRRFPDFFRLRTAGDHRGPGTIQNDADCGEE